MKADATPRSGEFQNLLTVRLSRLQFLLNARQTDLLKKTAGIGLTEWRVLFLLRHLGASSPGELHRASGMDGGLLSRNTARLRAAGLVSARESSADRRGRILRLTPKGVRLYEKIDPVMRAWRRPIFAALDESERKKLLALLNKLERAAVKP